MKTGLMPEKNALKRMGIMLASVCAWVLTAGGTEYYINDASTNGDVYTWRAGDDQYTGTNPCCPRASMQAIMEDYMVMPGDIIYVDSGHYFMTNEILFTASESGSELSPIHIRGSTNMSVGSTFQRSMAGSGSKYGFHFNGASHICMTHIAVTGGTTAIYAENVSGFLFSNIVSAGFSTYGCYFLSADDVTIINGRITGGDSAVYLEYTTNCLISQSSISRATSYGCHFKDSGPVQLEQSRIVLNDDAGIIAEASTNLISGCTIAYNLDNQLEIESGFVAMTNCIVAATNSGAYCIYWSEGMYHGDYNNLYAPGSAMISRHFTTNRTTLYDWQHNASQDIHSLSHAPLFQNDGQFHLQTAWTGTLAICADGAWSNHSPCIDTADPDSGFGREPEPNGACRNMGSYGNRTNAAQSLTNAWVLAVSLNDGGRVRDTVTLRWRSNLTNAGARVRLEYAQYGVSGRTWEWTQIATNLPAVPGTYSWNTAGFHGSPYARWRVVSESNTNVQDATDHPFELRPYRLYVNDASTVNDIYCTGPGASTNWGASSNLPLDKLSTLLLNYDLEYGDLVLVDAGTYTWNSPVYITADDGGTSDADVTVRGATNTLIDWTITRHYLCLDGAAYVTFEDMQFANGNYGVWLKKAVNCTLRNLQIRDPWKNALYLDNAATNRITGILAYNAVEDGVHIKGSPNNSLTNILVANSGLNGVHVEGSSLMNTLDHLTLTGSSNHQIHVNGGSLTLRNSIVMAERPGTYCINIAAGTYAGDYNDLYITNGAWAGHNNGIRATLTDWQNTGTDLHSISEDPQFVQVLNEDYHLQSREGCYFEATSSWITNSVHSPCIDIGDPDTAYINEPAPNGNRVNLGAFGNTAQASKGLTNAWLMTLNLNDGGILRGGGVLRWTGGNISSTATAVIRFSVDGGVSWSNVGSTIAGAESMAWDPGSLTSASCLWQVVVGSVTGQTEELFAVNPQYYYINDNEQTNDVYCTEAGSDIYPGLRPDRPMASLGTLLKVHTLQPSNTVFIDSGNYIMPSNVVIDATDSGTAAGGYVRIQGSTNPPARGTCMANTRSSGYGLHLLGADRVHLSDLVFTGSAYGVYVESSTNCRLDRLTVHAASEAAVMFDDTEDSLLIHSVIWSNNNGVRMTGDSDMNEIRFCTLAYNANDQVSFTDGSLLLYNSILAAQGSGSYCIYNNGGTYAGDYNDLYTTDGAYVGYANSQNQPTLIDWYWASWMQDGYSLAHDPLFADAGGGDFHLKSTVGRYVPATGSWVQDAQHSPCIDTADPWADIYNIEPEPNGGVANIGAYGQTTEASMSTNIWITAITFNDGGTARETVTLRWATVTNMAGTVEIIYLPGNGEEIVVTNGIPATNGMFQWNSSLTVADFQGSPFAQWRVRSESNPNIYDTIDSTFKLRPYTFFVNDGYTINDMYCNRPGRPFNSGVFSNVPLNSLVWIIENYDLEYEDRVYVDTGFYASLETVYFTAADQGSSNRCVQIQGSTNGVGTRFIADPSPGATVKAHVHIENASFIRLKDMQFEESLHGVHIESADGIELYNVVIDRTTNAGVLVENSVSNRFYKLTVSNGKSNGMIFSSSSEQSISNSIFWNNRGAGVHLSGESNRFENCVFVDNGSNQIYLAEGSVGVYYSIVVADAPYSYGIRIKDGTYQGNYNNWYTTNSGFVAWRQGTAARLSDWQRKSGGWDWSSQAGDPCFVDQASGDFHLRSRAAAGTYVDATDSWTAFSEQSPCIDACDPYAAYTNEPMPNGRRRNAGAYGNTYYASKSLTSSWVHVLSYNDGGVVRNEAHLYWMAYAEDSGEFVELSASLDGGNSWTLIDTLEIDYGYFSYDWDISGLTNYPDVKWRVMLQSDTNIMDMSDRFFAINPVYYYVNDSFTNGDIYCSETGSAMYDGLNTNRPLPSLPILLDIHDIEPGGTVYIDTGGYLMYDDITVTTNDQGVAGQRVAFIGSTNHHAGGSVIAPASGTAGGIVINAASHVALQELSITGTAYGVTIEEAGGCMVSNVMVRDAAYDGIKSTQADDLELYGLDISHCAGDGISVDGNRLLCSHCVSWANTGSGMHLKGVSNQVQFSVFSCNSNNQVQIGSGGEGDFRYNIAVHINSNGYAVRQGGDFYSGDYNNYYTAAGCPVGYAGGVLHDLSDWQQATTQDVYSLSHDPLFVDRDSGRFHLRSMTPYGTIIDADGTRTNFTQQSPCIDAGPPFGAVTNEPAPNGGHINLGRYGNTADASLSLTNDWLLAVSFNDGGTARGTNVPLRWLEGFANTATPARLEYSRNNGVDWEMLATNLTIGQRVYYWDTTVFPGSPYARWRIICGGRTDRTDRAFYTRPLLLYVNDGQTNGDIYCSTTGTRGAWGIASNQPALDLQALLDAYDLDYGDTIYIDTGFYVVTNGWTLAATDSGTTNGLLRILGSTNTAVGGSRIYDPSTNISARGMVFNNAQYVQLADIVFTGGYYAVELNDVQEVLLEDIAVHNARQSGIYVDQGESNTLRRVAIDHCAGNGLYLSSADHFSLEDTLILSCVSNGILADRTESLNIYGSRILQNGLHGIMANDADGSRFSNTVVACNRGSGMLFDSGDALLLNCTIASNQVHGLYTDATVLRLYNSIVTAEGTNRYCLYADDAYYGNYNDFWPVAGARVGHYGYPRMALSDWQYAVTQDVMSLSHDPLFADPGSGDFHLRSTVGRYIPAGWTNDTAHSPCIDTGPVFIFGMTNEPAPNGGRINLGAYGNTVEASMSASGRVLAVSQNDGGLYRSPLVLRWLAGNGVATVDLQYSTNGVDWTTIASGLNAAMGTNAWMVTNRSLNAWWRVASATWTDVVDQTFILNPNRFYVNDTNIAGDVFCGMPGSVTNRGVLSNAPALYLQDVFYLNDLEGGDTVFVDTGMYAPTGSITLTAGDAGHTGAYLTVRGNTNPVHGTVFNWPVDHDGFVLSGTRAIAFVDILMSNAEYAINVDESDQCLFSNLVINGAAEAGIYIKGVSNAVFNCDVCCGKDGIYIDGPHTHAGQCAVWSNSGSGIYVNNADFTRCNNNIVWRNGEPGLYINGASNLLEYCTIVDNSGKQVSVDGDSIGLYGNIIVNPDTNGICVNHSVSAYAGDFNDFYTADGGVVGMLQDEVRYLSAWQQLTTQDMHSMSRDPQFANRLTGDFHLRSTTVSGTWVRALGGRTNFNEHSPCIDAGPAFGLTTNEPLPSGGRINLGAYGNTAWASLSRTDAWLTVQSLNDGGNFSMPTNLMLRWNYGNMPSNQPVSLWRTRDNGTTWRLVVTNQSAGGMQFAWSVSNLTGSPLCHWLITTGAVSDAIADTNVLAFSLHPYACYVNDTQTIDDIYCTAVGSYTNYGVSSNMPQRSLQYILNQYTLAGGDVVYIDTGNYEVRTNIVMTGGDHGTNGQYVTFLGSTNETLFVRSSSTNGCYIIDMTGVEYAQFANMTLQGGYHGMHLKNAGTCIMSNMLIRQATDAGIYLDAGISNTLDGLTVRNCGSGIYINGEENTVCRSLVFLNLLYGILVEGSGSNRINGCTVAYNGNGVIQGNYQVGMLTECSLRNSIVMAEIVPGYTGREHVYCFASNTLASYHGDYNDLYFVSGAGGISPELHAFTNWTAATNRDIHSISADPHFIDPVAGDFHLRSAAVSGAWEKATSGWTQFATNSPCIDTGDPAAPNGHEPQPNGAMLNIGAFGNSPYASRSVDSDGEGLSDTFEAYARGFRWGLAPYTYKPFGSDPLLADTDGDGMDDYKEYISGTDPCDTNQCFAVTQLYPTINDHIVLSWPSAANRLYGIQWTTNMMQPFEVLATGIAATPPLNTYVVTNNLPVRGTFFRFLVEME
jgi:hypothetical protein